MTAVTFAGYVQARCTVPASTTISATNSGGGPTTVTLDEGTYFVKELVAQLQTDLNADRPDDWTVELSTTTGLVTIDCADEPYAITWSTTDIRDLLGFAGNISSTSSPSVGTKNCRGVVLLDCPLALDHPPLSSPQVSDLRITEGPTGLTYGVCGNTKYRHTNLRWSHVPRHKVFVAHEGTTHESWQRFLIDTQWGQGHPWFTPASKVKIYDHSSNEIGNGTPAGWYTKGLARFEPQRVGDAWDGLWRISIPELVSDS